MADRKDDFTSRRQFRQALSTLGAEHPRLLTANKVQRMDNEIEELTAEEPLKRPRGRPPKSGTNYLGEQTRFSVRIPTTLFDRFVAYAEGSGYIRGEVQLAKHVREALEHFLACPHKRQTQIKDLESLIYICPTENTQVPTATPPTRPPEPSTDPVPSPVTKAATSPPRRQRASREAELRPQMQEIQIQYPGLGDRQHPAYLTLDKFGVILAEQYAIFDTKGQPLKKGQLKRILSKKEP